MKKKYKGKAGMAQFDKDLQSFAQKQVFEKMGGHAVKKVMSEVSREAKRRAPVKQFGTLRQSIAMDGPAIKNKRMVGAVGSDVEYAPFLEFGTKHIEVGSPSNPRTSWPAKQATGTTSRETMPFLRSAIYALRSKINQIFKKEFRS